MDLCAVSRWREGCRNKGKAQFSSALDRISERIIHADFPNPIPAQKQSGVDHRKRNLSYISIGYGGESVSQLPLKDKAFLTFLGQNPPFELRPKTGVSPPIFSWNPSWLIQVLAQPFDFRRRWTAGLIGVWTRSSSAVGEI